MKKTTKYKHPIVSQSDLSHTGRHKEVKDIIGFKKVSFCFIFDLKASFCAYELYLFMSRDVYVYKSFLINGLICVYDLKACISTSPSFVYKRFILSLWI